MDRAESLLTAPVPSRNCGDLRVPVISAQSLESTALGVLTIPAQLPGHLLPSHRGPTLNPTLHRSRMGI